MSTLPLLQTDHASFSELRSSCPLYPAAEEEARRIETAQVVLDRILGGAVPKTLFGPCLVRVGVALGDQLAALMRLEWMRCVIDGEVTYCVSGFRAGREVVFFPLELVPKKLAQGQREIDLQRVVESLTMMVPVH